MNVQLPNTPNIFNFLLLVLFLYSITADSKLDSAYDDKQRKIATKSRPPNSSVETPVTLITAVITMPGEKIVNSELSNLSNLTKLNFKFREKLHTHVPKEIKRRKIFQRQIRNTLNKISELDGLECLFCFGDGVTVNDENCYLGVSTATVNCTYGQECYVELRPQSIRRGCVSRKRLNRTFACKCPLCNDKPSDDFSYYEYDKIKDWEYDNKRLSLPLVGIDLICKVCETKGTNKASDRACRFGKYSDYMVCGRNQVCYVNIDDETSFVSRGCTDKPVNNSFYKFCNRTMCNYNMFDNPKSPRFQQLAMASSHYISNSKGLLIKGNSNVFLFWCFIFQTLF